MNRARLHSALASTIFDNPTLNASGETASRVNEPRLTPFLQPLSRFAPLGQNFAGRVMNRVAEDLLFVTPSDRAVRKNKHPFAVGSNDIRIHRDRAIGLRADELNRLAAKAAEGHATCLLQSQTTTRFVSSVEWNFTGVPSSRIRVHP